MTGALFKFKGKQHRWKNAGLREASKDIEGFYLKIDGANKQGKVEQLYLYLDESDVRQILEDWADMLDLQIIRSDILV